MGILIVLLLMAAPAFAQSKELPAQGQPPKNLVKRADGHYTANTDPSNTETFEVHVVQSGETLSAIAQASLSNTKLWPQLWESNEHIVNPHWIYPNDKVLVHRLVPVTAAVTGATGVPEPIAPPPFAVASATLPTIFPPADSPEATPPPPKPIQYPTLILTTPPPPPPPKPKFELKFPEPKRTSEIKRSDMYCSGFIRFEDVSKDLKVIGKFDSDPGALATAPDYVYINVGHGNSVKLGTTFQIVRPTKEIHDPVLEQKLGRHYLEVGQVRVVLIQNDFAIARVIINCDALEIGDIVIPWEDAPAPQLPRPRPFSSLMTSSGQMRGYVALVKTAVENFGSVFKTSGKFAGVHSGDLSPLEKGIDAAGGIVYVDLGRNSGVCPGDLFIVYQSTEPDERLFDLPSESELLDDARIPIGEIVILKVEALSSTALITYSTNAIIAGYAIERRNPLK